MLADLAISDKLVRKVEDAPWRADGPDVRRDRLKAIRDTGGAATCPT